jgi:rhodanese-related sulfurtransferase
VAMVLVCCDHGARCESQCSALKRLGYRVAVVSRDMPRKKLRGVEAVYLCGGGAWADFPKRHRLYGSAIAVRWFYHN